MQRKCNLTRVERSQKFKKKLRRIDNEGESMIDYL
jgi:hypothetical protein